MHKRNVLVALVTAIGLMLSLGSVLAPAAAAEELLSRGDAGPAVATWQDRLNDWLQVERTEQGRLAVDGIYGPKTEAATRDFQDAVDIQLDGIVGPVTRNELDEFLSDGSDRKPLLSRGDAGPAVATWQDRLNDWLQVERTEQGRLAVDGIYGPKTEAATRDFQDAVDIQLDGIVGPVTRNELGEFLADA